MFMQAWSGRRRQIAAAAIIVTTVQNTSDLAHRALPSVLFRLSDSLSLGVGTAALMGFLNIVADLRKRRSGSSADRGCRPRANRSKLAFLSALLMTGALAGCATYEKCGPEGCPGDAQITANVRAQLDKHADLQGVNSIQVQTVNHVVYLSGEVSEGLQARTAESLARQTPGVTRVENTISVSK